MNCLRSRRKPMETLSYLKFWFISMSMAKNMGKLILLTKFWSSLSMIYRLNLKKITLWERLGKKKLEFKGKCLWLRISLARLRLKGGLFSKTPSSTTKLKSKKLNWSILWNKLGNQNGNLTVLSKGNKLFIKANLSKLMKEITFKTKAT